MALNPDDPALGGPPADPGAAAAAGQQWDPKTRAYIEEIRREAAGHRVRAKELEARLATENRSLRVDLALATTSHELGIDKDFATFLLSKNGWLASVDPSKPEFAQTLRDRLDSLVAENPQLRSTPVQVPPTTSGEMRGPGQVSTQLTRAQVADLAKRRPEDVVEALKRGDLNQLLRRSG